MPFGSAIKTISHCTSYPLTSTIICHLVYNIFTWQQEGYVKERIKTYVEKFRVV